MSKRFLLITTKNEHRVIEVPDSDFLSALKEIIGCECVEIVHVASNIVMLVDRQGKLVGKDVNYIASVLCPGVNKQFVGDVILASIGETEGCANIDGLSDDDADFFTSICDLGIILKSLLDGGCK